MSIEMRYTVDLNAPIKKTYIDTIFATEDEQAHTFCLAMKKGANSLAYPDDAIAKAYFIRYSDNVTVTINGSVNLDEVRVMLNKSCYHKPGQFALIIKVLYRSVISTVFYGEGTVFASRTDAILDEEHVIPSLNDLLAQIDAMEAAEAAANTATTNANNAAAKIDGMTVSAVNADTAAAVISEVNGVKHITFSLPKGDKGDPGAGGSSEAVPWLVGSTDEITPTQVKEALLAKRNVMITYTSPDAGNMRFSHFLVLDTVGAVASSCTAESYGSAMAMSLVGDLKTNVWSSVINELVKSDDIPTKLPNPYALTFTGAVTGIYDGSAAKTINIPTTAGEDGKTPVKGVDYWTDADQESIVQQVIAALGTPVFGRVDENNNIILTGNLTDETYTLKYEDAAGNLITIGTLNGEDVQTYVNRLKESIAADGSLYNGGAGWKADTRLNSSGAEVEATGTEVTGFMPFAIGDMLRFENIKITGTDTTNTTQYIVFYDANFAPVKAVHTHVAYNTSNQTPYFTLTSDGYWKSYDTTNIQTLDTAIDWNPVRYFRVSAEEITDNSIITINQQIV